MNKINIAKPMKEVAVKIKLNGGIMPRKATEGAAAYDLYVPEDITIDQERQIIDLKFSIELPCGYAATIQPRSGFSARGIEAMVSDTHRNIITPLYKRRINADVIRGLIDCDYRGNVGVILKTNEFHDTILLNKGTRIAQMQIVEVPNVFLLEVDELSDSLRGENGFGSTGVI